MQETKQLYKTNRTYKKYLLLIVVHCSLLIGNCLSQSITWQRVLNNGYGRISKVQQTSDGGYISVGSDRLNNEYKILLVKFDNLGNILWSKRIGAGEADGYWVEEASDKGFIIGGDVYIGSSQAYLVKKDSNGTIQWEKMYSNAFLDQCSSVKQTVDGGYILGCRTQANNANTVWLIKTDPFGNIVWQKVYNNRGSHIHTSEIEIVNNGYASVGSISSTASNVDIILIQYNLNGDTIRSRIFGGSGTDVGNSIDAVSGLGFIFGGSSTSFNGNKIDSYIISTDTALNIIWQRTFSNTYDERCTGVRYLLGRGYVMAVDSDTNVINHSQAVIRVVDLNGNILKEKHYYPLTSGGWFNDVELTLDGGFILGGETNSDKMYIVKTDSLLYAEPIGISGNQTSIPNSVLLAQNYPNPFNPSTVIKFDISKSGIVKLNVYDMLGREIFRVEEFKPPGSFELNFDGSNFASGMYFYSLETNGFKDTKKMVLIK
jgi:Secretion system C-terminal sorting domain